jgi:hypothetical protein
MSNGASLGGEGTAAPGSPLMGKNRARTETKAAS